MRRWLARFVIQARPDSDPGLDSFPVNPVPEVPEMKVTWWQGGVYIEPKTDAERQALRVMADAIGVTKAEPASGANSSS